MTAQEPSSGWIEGRTHHLAVRVYYEDTDFTGVVYHGNYVRYFERGRSDFLRMIGVSHAHLLEGEQPAAFTIVKLELAFRKPARIDDALVVTTTYDALRGPRLFATQSILRGPDLLATAAVAAACITMDGKPRRPDAGLKAALTEYLTP